MTMSHVPSLSRNLGRSRGWCGVGVHLEEVPELGIGQALLEGRDHGRAAAALLVACQEIDTAGVADHGLAHRGRRSVRAAVVGHADVDRLPIRDEAVDQGPDVLALVERGHDHEGAAGAQGDPPTVGKRGL
jgi:hypothetical protein